MKETKNKRAKLREERWWIEKNKLKMNKIRGRFGLEKRIEKYLIC